jgi:sucrose-phosphate synthase
MILALARPDPKKNITTLLRAFGERRPLRELANLVHAAFRLLDLDESGSTNINVERLYINILLT